MKKTKMNADEIIAMAHEAEIYVVRPDEFQNLCIKDLEAFAKLVAAKERENVIQHLRELKILSEDGAFTNEIRARGEA